MPDQTLTEDHFRDAGLRHVDDAQMLRRGHRLPNADHLAGFAVECLLKSLLIRFDLASMSAGNVPKPRLAGTGKNLGHMPGPADEIVSVEVELHGRGASRMVALARDLSEAFEGWDVADRYKDGRHVKEATVASRLDLMERTVDVHAECDLFGGLV